jgi:hypothetical protein
MWSYRSASIEADSDALSTFSCWDGDEERWWIQEVENHIRAWVLECSEHVLLLYEDDVLIGLSAFSRTTIIIPSHDPSHQPAWKLDLVAIALDHQSRGISYELYQRTFSLMNELDPERRLVTGAIYEKNHASLASALKVGLIPTKRDDSGYLRVLGGCAMGDED